MRKPLLIRRRSTLLCLISWVATGTALSAAGDETSQNDATSVAQSCLAHPKIKQVKIVNERNILFTTRDNQTYNNVLPRQCGVTRNSLLNYNITHGRLCAGDGFSVMWQTSSGNDYVPALTCRLGMFVPVSEDEVADLMAMTSERDQRRQRRRTERELIRATPVSPAPAAATPTASDTSAPADPVPAP